MRYQDIITLEPGKRSGQPCIRGIRITVYDVLSYLAAGMTPEEILKDFPYLRKDDILACLSYAADRERRTWRSPLEASLRPGPVASRRAAPGRLVSHLFPYLPARGRRRFHH